MSPANEPLFVPDRDSFEQENDRAANEEDALLSGDTKVKAAPGHTYAFWRQLLLFIWALVATAIAIALAVLYSHHEQTQPSHGHSNHGKKPHGKRNLIFMVSDGMGPASLSLTRSFRQHVDGLPIDDVLSLDRHYLGSSRTMSSNSLVTDSAAGATAFSCGLKSYNGAISMLPGFTPCGTVMEAAKRAGYTTGLVVTTDITDATPACFVSHVNYRMEEDSIAAQEVGEHPLGRVVDLMLGGGRCHFLPNSSDGSCRQDNRDIVKMAQEKYGWNYVDSRAGFDKLKLGSAVKLPLLGLFAPSDIPFEIDRRTMNDVYPSLNEMARTALKALEAATQDSEKGFFLMIEGSRIDHAGHGNDPAAQVHEVIEYDKTIQTVIDFIDRSDIDGTMVSTSDHETGGLAVARQIHPTYPQYKWLPQALANASHSSEYLGKQLFNYIYTYDPPDKKDLEAYVRNTIVQKGLGIEDAGDEEIKAILDNIVSADYVLADMVSRRAQIGWSTHGHSAVDVNIYGTSGAEILRGNHENTEVGNFLRDYLDLDLTDITNELREKAKTFDGDFKAAAGSWMGARPNEEELRKAPDHHHLDGL
jgi:alkaline phosphatase